MKDHDIMPFGKYKGKKMGDVPASYLLWWISETSDPHAYPGVQEYIQKNEKHLLNDVRNERRTR